MAEIATTRASDPQSGSEEPHSFLEYSQGAVDIYTCIERYSIRDERHTVRYTYKTPTMRKKRTPLKKGEDIYFGVVRTHLRIKNHWLIPESDGATSEFPSTLWLRALYFPYRRGGVGVGICIPSLVHITRINKNRSSW